MKPASSLHAPLIAFCLAAALGAAHGQDLTETRAEYRSGATNPFIKHAPLAAFSVGSLAVGAAFYGIQSSREGRQAFSRTDRSSMDIAIAAAGATSLAAGISYFYYANRDARKARDWEASLSGGVAPDGSMRLVATLPLPLTLGL